jgi:hypothetical protein
MMVGDARSNERSVYRIIVGSVNRTRDVLVFIYRRPGSTYREPYGPGTPDRA